MTENTETKNIDELKDWRFEIDFEGIAWAVFDRENETMNTLGRRPTEELMAIIAKVEDAADKGDAKGLVIISGKETNFIAGADIREFDDLAADAVIEEALKATIGLFDRIEKMRVPVIAAIHGFCLGGGLYIDPVFGDYGVNAMVGADADAVLAGRTRAIMPAPAAIDYYGKLEAPSGATIRPGDTVILGFRAQAFVKRAFVVPISGISAGAPRIEDLWNSEGRAAIWGGGPS